MTTNQLPATDTEDLAAELARWAHSLRWEAVPAHVRELARLTWLDTFGCLLLGDSHPETEALAKVLADRGGGDAAAVGGAGRLAAGNAILVNALATGVHVFDGGNISSRGHVSGYVVPAVITAAELNRATFADALEAYLVGYEVAARIGAASTLRNVVFTSGTWGVVGAAAAIARLRGGDARAIADAIRLSANLTLAPSRQATIEGASVRDLYSALPSYLGNIAADLAAAGFRGGRDSIGQTFGALSGTAFDAGACLKGLGESWLMTDNYLKKYPGCRNFQAAVDAIVEILPMVGRPFDPQRDEVRVGIDPIGYRDNRAIHLQTSIAARESAPVSLALVLLHGTLTTEMYADGAYEAPEVAALAERIVIEEAKRETPAQRPGWATVTPAGGEPIHRHVVVPAGGAGNEMSLDEVKVKFARNAESRLGAQASEVADEMLSGSGEAGFADCLRRWLPPRA